MDRKVFDALEIEANGMTTPVQRAEYKAEKLMATYSEKMAELFQDLEPWQNYGVYFNGYNPINTTK